MYVDDDTRVRHILDAAREAQGFVAGRTRVDLDNDRMLYGAVVWAVTTIGEAASNLTPELRASLATVPWRDIVAMRNRLVHGYYLIEPDIVWDTVTVHLPPLVAALEQWLASQLDDTATPHAHEEAPC
jgi:uncharacterized protein with HEPN domain